MNVLNSKYYSKTKFFLKLIGLWPYKTSTRRWISLILYFMMTTSSLIPWVSYLVLKNPTFENFGFIAILIAFVFVSLLKYFVSFLNSSQLRTLLSQIKKDWKTIKDKEELNILENYAEESRLISSFYTFYVVGGAFTCSGVPLALPFIEKLFPLKNGSYPLVVLTPGEYLFFEQSDQLLLTNLHFLLANLSANCIHAGVDTFYLCTVQHVAALFAIDCHRLANVFKSDDKNINMKKLKDSVKLYNKCIRFCQLLEDSFSNCLFIILVLCPVGIGTTGYLIYNSQDMIGISKFTSTFIGIVIQLFYLNWVGQKIIDGSEKVFYSAYFSDWYLKPPKIQKYIIIIMCRSLKPHELSAGKMIILSMHSFGKLMRACTSIFAIFAIADRNFG